MPSERKGSRSRVLEGKIGPEVKFNIDGNTDYGAPRLMIKKMEFVNFKSYAGKSVLGPFHKSHSSIVGPNGSGKSNVIDGLLFVFGFSAKKIRLKKISELIHNSENHKNLQSCSVSVFFHEIIDTGNGTYEVVPDSDFVISRTATKDSVSTYYISNRRAKLNDVKTLLKSKGMDLENNRFLILQGEVELIAAMKPKAQTEHDTGMLEYLEDIIGSNVYVEAIEEAYTQVEALNEQRQEKLNRVKMVQKEKDSLEGAKLEAEDFLLKEYELNQSKCRLFQIEKYKAEKYMEQSEANKAELQAKLEHERSKMEGMATELSEMEEKYSNVKNQYDAICEECVKTKETFSSFERAVEKQKADNKHAKSKEKKLKASIKRLNKVLEETKAKIEQESEEIPDLEAIVVKLNDKLAKAEENSAELYEAVREKTEAYRAPLEAKEKELVPFQAAVNEAAQAVENTVAEIKLFQDRVKQASEKLQEVQADIKKIGKDNAQAQKQIAAERKMLERSEQDLANAVQQLETLAAEEKTLSKSRANLLSSTEEAKASLASRSSRGAVLEGLLKASKRGFISGFHGRLGDLGTIDDKYDVAISTACGGNLNQLVVDTTADATACIAYLKKRQLGRASFIMLDKIGHLSRHADRKGDNPANVPRLFDLVTPNAPEYRNAFYMAIQETLVCKDLDKAVSIANAPGKRRRVVTLSGQVIDASGTMSGGGTRQRKGAMSSSVSSSEDVISQQDVQNMAIELKQVESRLATVRAQVKNLNASISNLKKKVKQGRTCIKKLEMGIATADERLTELATRYEELETEAELTEEEAERIEALEAEKKDHQVTLEQAQQDAEQLENEVAELKQALMDAGGSELQAAKQEVARISKKIDENNSFINKTKVGIRASEKKVAKTEKSIADAEEDLEGVKQTIIQLKEDFQQVQAEARKVTEAFEQAQEQLDVKADELKAIEKEYESMKKVVDTIRGVEVELSNKIDDINKEISANKTRAKHWQKHLKKTIAAIQASVKLFKNEDEEETEEKKGKEEETKQEEIKQEEQNDDDDDEKSSKSKWQDFVPMTEEELERANNSGTGRNGDSKSVQRIKYEITMLEQSLSSLKPNMRAINEYWKKEAEYNSRVEMLDKVTADRDVARKTHDSLRKKRLDEFMAGFTAITMKVKEMYQMLTLGGDAELELVDSLDPFSEGIVFSVRPPKKSWKNISNLSGGEKTLSSLALVFALHHFKPTPIYVMDEIDAALDFKNVSIVANYINERTKNAQFIIISLRNNMFELADRLVGIYKTDNCTKSITIDPTQFVVAGGDNSKAHSVALQREEDEKSSAPSSSSSSIIDTTPTPPVEVSMHGDL